jgi:hypothetical protein
MYVTGLPDERRAVVQTANERCEPAGLLSAGCSQEFNRLGEADDQMCIPGRQSRVCTWLETLGTEACVVRDERRSAGAGSETP